MEHLHHACLHNQINECHFFSQLFWRKLFLDGIISGVVVEQFLSGSECWPGEDVGKVTDE